MDSIAHVHNGMALRTWFASYFLWYLGMIFVQIPLGYIVAERMCRQNLHVHGRKQVLWCLMCFVVSSAVMTAMERINNLLYVIALESNLVLVLFIALHLLVSVPLAGYHLKKSRAPAGRLSWLVEPPPVLPRTARQEEERMWNDELIRACV